MEELLNFQIDVYALNVNELSYELRIRNKVVNGTGRQKAIELKKAMELETEPPLEVVADEEDFNKAIEMLGDLQKELKAAIKANDEGYEKVVKSRIRHYQDRAFRATGNSDEADAILYGVVRNIKRIIRMSEDEREAPTNSNAQLVNVNTSKQVSEERLSVMGRGRGRKSNIPQASKDLSPARRREDKKYEHHENGESSSHQRRITDLFTRSDAEELNKLFENMRFRDAEAEQRPNFNRSQAQRSAETAMPRFIERRRVAIEKWPVRFSGDGAISLTDFLRKIELYAEADEVSMRDVWRGIFKLLEGIALEWYEVNAGFINSWEDLVRGLKTRFLSKNYDYMIREEILERMQQPNEPIADYLMKMNKLFLKVYPPLDEGYKVYVLQRNMMSQYRLQLTVADVTNVAQLEKLCKNMDEAKLMDSRQQMYHQPQIAQTSAAPQRRTMYRREETRNVAAVETVNHQPNQYQSRFARKNRPNRNESGTIKCWNCLQLGHRHFDCEKPRERVYCWCCGMDGFRADQCPREHRGGGLFSYMERPTQNNNSNQAENGNLGQ